MINRGVRITKSPRRHVTKSSGGRTPLVLGYHMPAEWEPHAATWLAWPHNRSDWPGKFGAIPWVYTEIVRALSQVERVHIVVNSRRDEEAARQALEKAGAVAGSLAGSLEFHRWPTNRGWTRDSGPIFVARPATEAQRHRGREIALVNFGFNAWAKYDDWRLDDQIPHRVAKALGCREFVAEVEVEGRRRRMVLEGGSIDVNGRGTLLTTEECLLSREQQRNPGLGRREWEAALGEWLGVTRVVWLGAGIVGDDTHGHVDDIARFVGPRTVVAASERRASDANYAPLAENLRRLQRATDQDGRPLEVVELPMPRPVVFHGQRLPASYANFYVANRLVLAPTFNDPNDRVALGILAGAFPEREVVGIHSGDLIWGLGALHCMTQQQPSSG